MIFLSPLPHFFHWKLGPLSFLLFLSLLWDVVLAIQVTTKIPVNNTLPPLVPLSLSIKFNTYGYTTPGRDEGYVTLPPCSFSMSCRPQKNNFFFNFHHQTLILHEQIRLIAFKKKGSLWVIKPSLLWNTIIKICTHKKLSLKQRRTCWVDSKFEKEVFPRIS